MILRSCGDGDLAIFLLAIWWLVPENIGDLVIMKSCGDGDLAIFYCWFGDKYRSQIRAKGAKNCHFLSQNFPLGAKNAWWFDFFRLVIGDLKGLLVMVILAIFCWWYGDLSHFWLVIWWLEGGVFPSPWYVVSEAISDPPPPKKNK